MHFSHLATISSLLALAASSPIMPSKEATTLQRMILIAYACSPVTNDMLPKRQYRASGFSKYSPQNADDEGLLEKRQYRASGFSKYSPQNADDEGLLEKRQYRASGFSKYSPQNADDEGLLEKRQYRASGFSKYSPQNADEDKRRGWVTYTFFKEKILDLYAASHYRTYSYNDMYLLPCEMLSLMHHPVGVLEFGRKSARGAALESLSYRSRTLYSNNLADNVQRFWVQHAWSGSNSQGRLLPVTRKLSHMTTRDFLAGEGFSHCISEHRIGE
ncbi:uncharacterized protein MYCFIDRAFT_180017 [Pseudocercospora fijiensis CIRAD86]|uniref:Uncharacterized protein n=1 Tax=Pseudocercospora fijiensis (strain CIRAD86) TaxID=383855 RepID=M3AJV8_PSEFD|nr:uncharacterized protein MYCFIDRAFT_180017 [Pseudocercospora fijiensis CIRAD86]EME77458.1 hypothetical protein MYCFIDRAFT_180017 [Pseudocercospora fijiensis CIRAD86]